MEQLFKKDGTSLKIMTEEDIKVVDIKKYITENDMYNIENAYYLNGIVYITIMMKSNSYGSGEIPFIKNSKFYPYGNAYGFVNIVSSQSDFGKILTAQIVENGNMYFWIYDHLDYGERITFIYPLKS